MKRLLIRIRDIVLMMKFYLQRTMSWVSLANSGMIMFLVFAKLQQEYKIEMDISLLFVPLYIFCLCVLTFIGYIDDSFKLYSKEAKISQSRSPFVNEMFARLDKIEEQLKNIEETVKS